MDLKLIPVSQDSLEWQCSVLKFGGATVLLNCGRPEAPEPNYLAPLLPHIGDLDLILLTHADLKHLGSLPYLLSRHPVACPVVCTEPVCRLGELSCVAYIEDNEKYKAPSDDFDVDDVLRIFMSRLHPLSYKEAFVVQPRNGKSLSVTPHPAGGHLGSACWTLQCGGLSALYLVDGDLRRGRFLDGLELQHFLPPRRGAALRWDVLITSPPSALESQLPHRGAHDEPQEVYSASRSVTVARSIREQVLLEGTVAALRRGGSVVIPADTAGRVPEILLLMEAAWSQDRQLSANYPLVWLSSTGDMVLDQVKTRLEYMSSEVLSGFEERFGQHPFVLRHVKIFQSLDELCATHPLSRPKVIITTSPHLTYGDSREIFFRLCADPRTLLWLQGVPPAGTLGRQLLDDFVVAHATKKEYRLQQHLKQALPEEQLQNYYEARLRELADSGLRWPATLPPELNPKVEQQFEEEKMLMEGELGTDKAQVTGEDASNSGAVKEEVPAEAKPSTSFPILARNAGAVANRDLRSAGASTLWAPLGWPSSRTLAHGEARCEGDEYGHVLTAPELREWRAQDQEGHKYSNPATKVEGEDEAADATKIKEEQATATKAEEEVPAPQGETLLDYRDVLRLHFHEPMHTEVRERTIRVACRVRYVPEVTQDPRDLTTMVRLMAPRHVVFLPTADFVAGVGTQLSKELQYGRLPPGTRTPEVHNLHPGGSTLHLGLKSAKRKIQFNPELWQKLSFLRTSDGVRVARVRAEPAVAPEASPELRVLELAPASTQANGTNAVDDDEVGGVLPRDPALFLGLAKDPVSLSGLKEQMRDGDYSSHVADFCPPGEHLRKPWSSRVLVASNTVAIGWLASPGLAAPQAPKGKESAPGGAGANRLGSGRTPVLRVEGVPGADFYKARAALYNSCALV